MAEGGVRRGPSGGRGRGWFRGGRGRGFEDGGGDRGFVNGGGNRGFDNGGGNRGFDNGGGDRGFDNGGGDRGFDNGGGESGFGRGRGFQSRARGFEHRGEGSRGFDRGGRGFDRGGRGFDRGGRGFDRGGRGFDRGGRGFDRGGRGFDRGGRGFDRGRGGRGSHGAVELREELPLEKQKVVSLFIHDVVYTVDVKIVRAICEPYGTVKRISVIPLEQEDQVKVLVEFEKASQATALVENLLGSRIYSEGNLISYACINKYVPFVQVQYNDRFCFDVDRMPDTMSARVLEAMSAQSDPDYRIPTPIVSDEMDEEEQEEELNNGDEELTPPPSVASTVVNGHYFGSGGGGSGRTPPLSLPRRLGLVSCVLRIDGIPPCINGVGLFNLLSVYGNVCRVRFLVDQPEDMENEGLSCLVVMQEGKEATRIRSLLNGIQVFGKTLRFSPSSRSQLEAEEARGRELGGEPLLHPDGQSLLDESEDFYNFHRFGAEDDLEDAQHKQPPSQSLCAWGFPLRYKAAEVKRIVFGEVAPKIVKLSGFAADEKGRGKVNVMFDSVADAVEALVICNYKEVEGCPVYLDFTTFQ